MTYRLDDEGAFLDAAVNAGNEAYGACVRAGQHCAHQMTDGVFSRAIAMLIASDAVWEKAIEAGLVERIGNGELRVVDFLQWNPSAKESKKLRKARSEAGKLGGKRSSKPQASASAIAQANSDQRGEGYGEGVLSPPESDPDPTSHRPSPTTPTRIQPTHPPFKPDGESPFDLAERVWLELWQAKYRRKFRRTFGDGDKGQDRILQRLGHAAFAEAEPEVYMRHWVKSYLALKDKWVQEHDHPLAGIEMRLNEYGEPKGAPRSGVRPVASQMPAEHPPAILDMAELSRRATAAANLGKATG